jgi:large subunit ribosomal protein L29
MPLLKAKQVREMTKEERAQKLRDLENELLVERGKVATQGGGKSAGRVKALRREVARMKTVMWELREA